MLHVSLPGLDGTVSRIGLGTRAIGGANWGGTDPETGIQTIQAALLRGVNFIETAPDYGFGLAEEIVGSAVDQLEEVAREDVVIATRAPGPVEPVAPEASREPVRAGEVRESVEASLERLQFDGVDLLFVRGPIDDQTAEDLSEELDRLRKEGKIQTAGYVPGESDPSPLPSEDLFPVVQVPLNLFERDRWKQLFPNPDDAPVRLGCGSLCRGLLSGRMTADRTFQRDDLRKRDPRFQGPAFEQHLEAVRALDELAQEQLNSSVRHLAVRWVLDRGATIAVTGARTPEQSEFMEEITADSLPENVRDRTNDILADLI